MVALHKIIPSGKIYQCKRRRKNYKTAYQFVIWKHDEIRELLEQISNRLIIKKERAKLLLEFLESRSEFERPRDKSGKFTKTKANEKEYKIYQKFKHL